MALVLLTSATASAKSCQIIQNAAARILPKARKFHNITQILASLHGLPIHVRSHSKKLPITYKILNGHAPSYLSDLLIFQPMLLYRDKKMSANCRDFSYRASIFWNNFPAAPLLHKPRALLMAILFRLLISKSCLLLFTT